MRRDFMIKGIQGAIKKFSEHNKRSPKQVIIYRDAVGGPSMVDKCFRIEVPAVISGI